MRRNPDSLSRKSLPKPSAPRRPERPVSAALANRSARVHIAIPRNELPLNLVVPAPAPQPDALLNFQTQSGVRLSALLKGPAFRRKMAQIAANSTALVFVTGLLGPNNRLLEAGLLIENPRDPSAQTPG